MDLGSVGLDSFDKARYYTTVGNYGRAFAHYLVALEAFPHERSQIEDEFFRVVWTWTEILEKQQRLNDLLMCLDSSYRYYPNSRRLQSEIGLQILRRDEEDLAMIYLQKYAPVFYNDYLPNIYNMIAAKLMVIPRWHFSMLNDKARNSAYKAAILNTLNKPKQYKVLDIGCGTGLLSLYASECENVKKIVAVERSRAMTFIAKSVLGINDLNKKISLINRESTTLTNQTFGKFDILITEIFDASVFGENALQTLVHAWDNLLETNAEVIPSSVDVFVTGVNSINLLRQYSFEGLIPGTDFHVTLSLEESNEQPYETEHLQDLPVDYITSTVSAFTLNFSNVSQLRHFYKNNKEPITTIKLKALKTSTIHAFALWFDLHLNEYITLTTDPRKDAISCWQQAVYYPDYPLSIIEGEEIELEITCINSVLKFKVLNHNQTSLENHYRVSQTVINYFNDPCTHIVTQLPLNGNSVADLHSFPLYGVLMAHRGAVSYITNERSDEDQKFLQVLIEKLNCMDRIKVCKNAREVFKDSEHYATLFFNAIYEDGTLSNIINDVIELETINRLQMYPMTLNIVMEIMESKYLEYSNKVYDNRLGGYQIAEFFNKYAVECNGEIQIDRLNKKVLSNRIVCSLTNIFTYKNSINYTSNFEITDEGEATGVLYWFEIIYNDNCSINTLNSTYYDKACFIFKNSRQVKPGDIVKVNIEQQHGLLGFTCV